MLYAKIENGAVTRYPVAPTDILIENRKNVSFPEGVLSAATMAEFGCAPVTEPAAPAYDTITQSLQRVTPTLVAGAWVQTWAVTELFPIAADKAAAIAANLVTVKTDLSKQIDAAVLAVYDKPVALAREYTKRLKGATDYKAAGYAGVVPPRVAAFATAAGLTATAAADRVILQAAQYEGAEDALSDLRMRKFEVQRATTEVDARAAHTAIMGQIAVIAAGLA